MTTECTNRVGQICERMRAVREENETLRRLCVDVTIRLDAVIASKNVDIERYRAALVEIVGDAAHFDTGISLKVKQVALNALAIRTESGQLSDDSGPIAGYSALRGVDDHQPQKSIAEAGK